MNTISYRLPQVIVSGIYSSLLAGLIVFVVLQVLLLLFRNARSFYKYHLGNAALLVCLVSFAAPFQSLFRSAPGNLPAHNTTATVRTVTMNLAATPTGPAPISLSESAWTIFQHQLSQWSSAIFILYIAGLAFFSIKLMLGWYYSRKLKRTATALPEHSWDHLLEKVLQQMNIRRNVIIRYSSDVLSPCIIGYTKAIILVPVSLCTTLTAEQAEAVLIHELAHLKQLDYFWNIITQTITSLLFFNPFVWLIARKCTQYREYACDELVKGYGSEVALSESLLAIAQFYHRRAAPALALYNNKNQLFNRVQNLLSMKKPTRIAVPSWMLTLAFTLCFIFAAPSATESQPASNNVDNAIQRAYRNGNKYFILFQAIKDGIIPTVGDYNFEYRHDSVFFDERLLSEPLQSQYASKIKKFYTDLGCKKVPGFSLRGMMNQNDVLDSNSIMQKIPVPSNRIIADGRKSAIDLIATEMARDGIADTLKGIFIEYNKNGVFVGHVQLKGASETKYKKLLRIAEGYDPDKPEESYFEIRSWVEPFSKR